MTPSPSLLPLPPGGDNKTRQWESMDGWVGSSDDTTTIITTITITTALAAVVVMVVYIGGLQKEKEKEVVGMRQRK